MKILAVIPARWASTRFPGKPLAQILGKTMLERVYNQVKKSNEITDILVATDDDKIINYCNENNMNVILTSDKHNTGTDRVAEVATKIDADIYVNIQGDEPIIPPKAIDNVVIRLKELISEGVLAVNAFDKDLSDENAEDKSIVKMVTTVDEKQVLFLSRYPIPYEKADKATKKTQLGLYAFTKLGLEIFSNRKMGPIENSENVEMLRYIEYGDKLGAVEVPAGSVSIDFEHQIKKVEEIIIKNKLE